MNAAQSLDDLKRQAALTALEYVHDGMVVGLGTGSTALHMIAALAARVKDGLRIQGVSTSRDTSNLARQHGIALLEEEGAWIIDVAIDGADQVDPYFNLIKGGGGALLREKIVAAAAKQLVIVVDHTKRVPVLGGSFPLPVEVMPFGWESSARWIEDLGLKPVLRQRDARPFTTDGGHYILDSHVDSIPDPAQLESKLNLIPGVVENGLFVGRTSVLVVGTPQGVETLKTGHYRGSL